VQQGTLQEALAVWLLYLGVAKGVHVTETGQMGCSWLIIQGKGEALPLSAVGVGVSQVLPLLVMGCSHQHIPFWSSSNLNFISIPHAGTSR